MTKQNTRFADNPLDYSLLERLTQAFGPSGSEEEVVEIIAEEVHPFCDEHYTDSMGNLIAIRHGSGKRIMVAAHMDEIGLMVTHIDEQGFLRFMTIGGIRIAELPFKRVRLKNGRIGTIGQEKIEKPAELELAKLFIDIGASSREEAEQVVGIGDTLTFMGEFAETGSRLIAKAMDDRVGCFVAIEALKRTKSARELMFVFTVQEEVGLRGAHVAAYALSPDLGIAVDVTRTGDTPQAHKMAVKLGGGVAIKVLDRSMITPPKIKRWMAETAVQENIEYQWEVLENGGTDSGAIHLTKAGILSGVISIPTRHIHTPSEIVDRQDVESAVSLLTALLESNIEI
ncbi:MAG: M42 family metallopeptidase [Desulfitobacteriaceae bacterium]